MKIQGRVAVITGGASGIGRALALRFRQEGAKHIVVADLQEELVGEVAREIDGMAIGCDVTNEADIQNLVSKAEEVCGPIDIFCSNAGLAIMGGEDSSDVDWHLNWDTHVMAHVYAARAVAPKMAARGSGYLVNTSSAAGLLSHVDSATYSVTKHAAVAFAEWLSIAYGDLGVRVSVLCPQAVRTAMLKGREDGVASVDGVLEPEQLADTVIETMDREAFLILPHPKVLDYLRHKTADYDRWLAGMRKLRGAHVQRP